MKTLHWRVVEGWVGMCREREGKGWGEGRRTVWDTPCFLALLSWFCCALEATSLLAEIRLPSTFFTRFWNQKKRFWPPFVILLTPPFALSTNTKNESRRTFPGSNKKEYAGKEHAEELPVLYRLCFLN